MNFSLSLIFFFFSQSFTPSRLIESVNRRLPATNYARSGQDVYHPNEFRSQRGDAAKGARDSDGQDGGENVRSRC